MLCSTSPLESLIEVEHDELKHTSTVLVSIIRSLCKHFVGRLSRSLDEVSRRTSTPVPPEINRAFAALRVRNAVLARQSATSDADAACFSLTQRVHSPGRDVFRGDGAIEERVCRLIARLSVLKCDSTPASQSTSYSEMAACASRLSNDAPSASTLRVLMFDTSPLTSDAAAAYNSIVASIVEIIASANAVRVHYDGMAPLAAFFYEMHVEAVSNPTSELNRAVAKATDGQCSSVRQLASSWASRWSSLYNTLVTTGIAYHNAYTSAIKSARVKPVILDV